MGPTEEQVVQPTPRTKILSSDGGGGCSIWGGISQLFRIGTDNEVISSIISLERKRRQTTDDDGETFSKSAEELNAQVQS